MTTTHQEKIDELIDSMAQSLKAECQRLLVTGALNVDSYSKEQYVLARTLVSAAMHIHANDFANVVDKKFMENVKNLTNF